MEDIEIVLERHEQRIRTLERDMADMLQHRENEKIMLDRMGKQW